MTKVQISAEYIFVQSIS